MATYLSGSNVQADAMQTLYLMNPGCNGYANSSNLSNIVLPNSTARSVDHENSPHHPGQQQQEHCIGFSLPSDLTQSRLAEQSHMPVMLNSNMQRQELSSNASRVSGNGYSWNGGNELLFIPSSGMTNDHQSSAARHNSVDSGEQSRSGMSHYGAGSHSQSFLEEPVPLVPNGIPLGLNMDNLQASTGAGQILSLSLSSQQPSIIPLQSFNLQHNESGASSQRFFSAGVENNANKGDRFPNKCCEGSLDYFRTSREGMPGTAFQYQRNGAGYNRQINIMLGAYGSQYLKAAQELLNEVVSVGRSLKNSSSKHAKLQCFAGPGSTCDGYFPNDRNLAETTENDGAPVVSWSSGRDGKVTVAAVHPTAVPAVPEHNFENTTVLAPSERQELQMKKAKLMAMLDEVDQRYKQYYNQMQIVVVSFESAAGLGAARTYTALALQTISKHIRCLRDAISGQLHVTSRALGEDEKGRGETSRLPFVDKHLHQQHALQQLGMVQQHAWRPQRGLPERSVSILRAWMFEHFLHPYPKDADKIILARQTGLSRSQVSNWFINARVRLWKPMVEEMYTEEIKEAGTERADKLAFVDREDIQKGGRRLMDDAEHSEMINGVKQAKVSEENSEGFLEAKKSLDHASQSRYISSSSSDSFIVHENDNMMQGLKKSKIGVEGSSTAVDIKFDETHGGYVPRHDIETRTRDEHREHHSIHQSGISQANYQNLGAIHVSGLNRYSQEGLTASNAANGGVSLTLGLKNFEGLSQAQQHYVQGQGQRLTGQLAEGGGWFS